jgi:SpoVK/Ycf46/Vps4 family AAA+-type ATPase
LDTENFKEVQARLKDSSMRSGFACLFYGPPGTGKTETAYQLARETKRDIMLVDISQTKSKWFGESEKQIKQLFDRYSMLVKSALDKGTAVPILLFNEADAVIGKRLTLKEERNGPGQTENAIQNIILQEIENLTGILIATTNLTENMDKAFERRFLYKIEFEKPNQMSREAIWKSIIPALTSSDTHELASRYDFSGGQIENISRKRAVETVISGKEPTLETLLAWCKDEMLDGKESKRVGFAA